MSVSRHEKRKLLIQALFLQEFGHHNFPRKLDCLKFCWNEFSGLDTEKDLNEFDKDRFSGVIKNLKEIKQLTAKYAPEWPLDQIAPHDRIIFYLAYFELLYTDTPGPVVINEAVELAKSFGGDRSSRFINGALSTAFHELKDQLPEKEAKKSDSTIEEKSAERKTKSTKTKKSLKS
jgi:transcription antitermination protein NusB